MIWVIVVCAVAGIAWCLKGSTSLEQRYGHGQRNYTNDAHLAQYESMSQSNQHGGF